MIAQQAKPQKSKPQQQSDKPNPVDHSAPLKKQKKIKPNPIDRTAPLKKQQKQRTVNQGGKTGESKAGVYTHFFDNDQKEQQARQEGMSLSYVFLTELAYNTSIFIYFQNRSSFI